MSDKKITQLAAVAANWARVGQTIKQKKKRQTKIEKIALNWFKLQKGVKTTNKSMQIRSKRLIEQEQFLIKKYKLTKKKMLNIKKIDKQIKCRSIG